MASSPDPTAKARLESQFPLLKRTHYVIRGRPDIRYNCIAWALGSTTHWIWPGRQSVWPIEPRVISIDSFINAFATYGFEQCPDAAIEQGYEKIALFVAVGLPTHAAKIESPTRWTSKLGRAELIEHEPNALNGITYGIPQLFFRKNT